MHTPTTIIGNLVENPMLKKLSENGIKADFRLACSRRVPTKEGQWIDADQLFIDVECWGDLAVNVKKNLIKGRPVICVGHLSTDSWMDKNDPTKTMSKIKLRAHYVGLEMTRYELASRRSSTHEVAHDGLSFSDTAEPLWDKDYTDKTSVVGVGALSAIDAEAPF
ncbi:putative single-strand binding protein [Corynebacterium kutscheri]|uniref:Single-strand binding protein n=1 Tax=Corynebacterium kutscheri TaxID=35755 RepID=A0A0F6QZ13_9CORY|nr:single-stranded DNA-binding protein [Corynebacterium kutscheri]AKE40872.1 single-stranded DNA-binding protein [Corynebacterium kutscheri]VEH06627.1 putative single-strand binding protein [Corynebacterium kutscheri]VEH09169.1 putative single-strand binding protein [Corynebacterium kutscheri]VEH82557.1 putative single-strand binding protein [Corynebacterium kutscheri]